MVKSERNNYGRAIIRAVVYGDGTPKMDFAKPPRRGKNFADNLLCDAIATDPKLLGGYIVYRDKNAAMSRARELYKLAAPTVAGERHVIVSMRDNVIYIIKAADGHA